MRPRKRRSRTVNPLRKNHRYVIKSSLSYSMLISITPMPGDFQEKVKVSG